MPFTHPLVLGVFLPVVLGVYFTLCALEARRPGLSSVAAGSVSLLLGASVVFVALGVWSVVSGGPGAGSARFVPLGLAVVACHAIAYVIDVRRGEAAKARPLTLALYLLQFPLLLAGPLVRFRDFSAQLSHRAVGMSGFAYGVRRLVTGLVKVRLIADTLAVVADRIFALPTAKLSTDAAWLGAVCGSLHVYFLFGGYSDMAIGLGRMLGFRYPENFRRPYTAGSVREFWRTWNITLITWLRDYLYLPIAGQDRPTLRLYVNIVAGFCLVGLWHGAGLNSLPWGVYFGTLLALEAIGLGARIERLPAALRHAYLLAAVVIGWVILRTPTVSGALEYLMTMAGFDGLKVFTAERYLTPQVWLALGLAALGAGPLVPSISRWRVSVDAAATSFLMMMAATGVFIWRPVTLVTRSLWPSQR